MQNPLQDIKQAEEEAQKIINKALSKQSVIINDAKKKADEDYKIAEQNEKAALRAKLEKVKVKCSDYFRTKRQDADQEAKDLEKKAEFALREAVKIVLNKAKSIFIA